jgi:hypothetical protein
MINVPLALALALITPAANATAPSPAPSKQAIKRPAAKPAGAKQPSAKLIVPTPSADATRVADWIAASGDNHALPYAIIDKVNAALFLFDAKGKPLGATPVLIGVAVGDEATPGIGSKNLAEIGPAEKTTPAGRFLAKYGLAFGKERILWVDYATSVALHPIPRTANKKERRAQRMLSPTPDDNRITFGCINVPQAFYDKGVSPQFRRKGGYVYILPDTRPIEDVFPRLRVQALTESGTR